MHKLGVQNTVKAKDDGFKFYHIWDSKILKFHPTWKLKMCAILIKDGWSVVFKDKENKQKGMTDKVFTKNNALAMENIYLALDEMVLFNVSEENTAKGL